VNRSRLYNKLICDSFEKAKADIGSNKVTRQAHLLSDYIHEDSNTPYGERSLREHLNKIRNDETSHINFQPFVADALSRYLGCENFEDYLNKNSIEKIKKKKTHHVKKWGLTMLSITVGVILGLVIYSSANEQRWMIWDGKQYVEVPFDADLLEKGKLKLYKQDRIDRFKKIEVKCSTEFFNHKEEATIFYGKNLKKEHEYFTDLGLHPETGKPLKPISTYIIEKYICVKD
jgi:hypothetical protein